MGRSSTSSPCFSRALRALRGQCGHERKGRHLSKGMWGKAVASKAQLYDKRPGHIHIENVSLDVLETKLAVIRAPKSEPPLSK